MPFLYAGVSSPTKPSLLGRIQQFRHRRRYPWLIQLDPKAAFTHTYFRYHPTLNGRQVNDVYHSIGVGNVTQAYENFKQHRTIYAEFAVEVDEERFEDFCEQCRLDSLKYPYSRKGNIGLILAWMFGLSRNPLDRTYKEQRCSETTARMASRYYGAPYWGDLNFNLVWPADVLRQHLELEQQVDWCRLHAGRLFDLKCTAPKAFSYALEAMRQAA